MSTQDLAKVRNCHCQSEGGPVEGQLRRSVCNRYRVALWGWSVVGRKDHVTENPARSPRPYSGQML